MEYVTAVMSLLGGIGVLLFGFKVLSDAIEKLANTKLRGWFSKTSSAGKFAGVGIGTVTTALVQSSGATTVITVGFVNAGIMSLSMATAIIMGANIGTTITAQIAALSAFEFSAFILPLAFVGIFMTMLSKKDKVRTVGNILGGLGLVFVGLEFMSSSMKTFSTNPAFTGALTSLQNPFLLLLIGIGFTALLQSSSAVTTIVISMAASGLIIGSGGNSVLFLILGSNIGSCITAILSSIGANTNAKRAAFIHLLFNLFGTLIFTIMLLLWPSFMEVTLMQWFPDAPTTQIAMFHTFFNTICVIVFFPFIDVFVKIATFIIRDKKVKVPQEETYLDERLLKTPSIALMQAKKEVTRLATISIKTLRDSIDCFTTKDLDSSSKIKDNILHANDVSKKITKFLVKLSSEEISYSDEKIISRLHESLGDILRIADLADNMTKYTRHYVEDEFEFSDAVLADIKLMNDKLGTLFEESMLAFGNANSNAVVRAEELEDEIDGLKRKAVDGHIKRLNEGTCQPQSSSVFINLVGNIERAADHVLNLAHAFEYKVA
ncbi:MAG: Na/Pi cotransporter family protein [Clostridia bacterium]|nr:Na/Pi cotransporter family protein [Clostridia bacterium]